MFTILKTIRDVRKGIHDPAGLGQELAEDVVNWSMTSARYRSCNVSYYYPHGLASNLDGNDVMCAASGIALKTIAYSDTNAEVFMAPAGARRGLVYGVSQVGYYTGPAGTPNKFVEVNLNQGQRDNLYEYMKNINPIVFFPGRGIIIWGQKTSAPAASAMDRINVVRLLMMVRRDIRKGMFPFVFEPNDKLTREAVKSVIDGYLGDILIRRGLYDYLVVCDDINNTPTRIDRNELWAEVLLKPVRAVEFIYVPIRVLSTAAKMG
jgi:phage tail sheath protein FI